MTITVEEAFFYTMAADIEVLRLVLVAQFARLGEVQPESLLELKHSILDHWIVMETTLPWSRMHVVSGS